MPAVHVAAVEPVQVLQLAKQASHVTAGDPTLKPSSQAEQTYEAPEPVVALH
jgi:hypothetical protein